MGGLLALVGTEQMAREKVKLRMGVGDELRSSGGADGKIRHIVRSLNSTTTTAPGSDHYSSRHSLMTVSVGLLLVAVLRYKYLPRPFLIHYSQH